jgi:Protein of unknown function (DUF2586)
MSLPNVSIKVNNKGLGLLPPLADGQSAMLIVTNATGLSASLFAGVKTLTASNYAADFTEAYDTANNEQVHFHFKQFFASAASDAILYVGFAALASTNAQLVTKGKEILDFAGGEVRFMGIALNKAVPATFSLTSVLGVFVDDVVKPLRLYSLASFAPVSFLLEGYGMGSTDANVGGLANLRSFTAGYVSVVIGSSYAARPWCANVGMLLGWLSTLPVQRKIARVKSGAPTVSPVYIADALLTINTAYSDVLNTKGYITYRKFAGKQGFYFVDDPTATAATDDLNTIARNRIVDKATRLAYAVYVEEIQDEIEVDPVTGRIAPAKARYYEVIINNAINAAMTNQGEINSIDTEIDLTQNVIVTNKLAVKLRLTPDAYSTNIEVDLGLKNPFV